MLARELYYRINRAVVCKYAQFIHNLIISLSLSFSLAARLSLIPSHSHALQQLIRFINSYHRFYRQNQLCQPIVKFRAHPAAYFPLLIISNPSYSFACTKAKAKFISIHSSSFSSFFYLLLILGDHNATRGGALVGWRDVHLHVVSHARI